MRLFLYPLHRGLTGLLVLILLSALTFQSQAQSGSVTTTQSFSYTGQIVTYTVPAGVTSLTIEARGAEGGDIVNKTVPAGKGAIVSARVSVTPGQSLSILAGQQLSGRAGGGGGSFVVAPSSTTAPTPLVIAGGGGGAGFDADSSAKHGQLGSTGGIGVGGGEGGTNGQGGGSSNRNSGGGGGLLGDGRTSIAGTGGRAFINGGAGGTNSIGNGGFGGGGGGGSTSGGGGGGGYSGGGGGNSVGGGGGSFSAGTRLFARTGATDGNSGNGLVIISYSVQADPDRSTATAIPDNLSVGGTATIVAKVVDASGNPLAGATVSVYDNANKLVGTDTTTPIGSALVPVTSSQPGTIIYTVVAGGVTLNSHPSVVYKPVSVVPNLTINDVSLNEGNSGTTSFVFTVSLSAPAPTGGVSFDIATADGTAMAPGDYTAKSLTSQTIPAGSSTYNFTVLVNGDTSPEANETFFVNVTNAPNATITDGQGVATIINDDVAPTIAGFAASPSAVCVGSPVTFTATIGNVTGSYTYTLSNGNSPITGSSSMAAFTQSLTTSGSGTQSYTLTVMANNGQLATAVTSVTVNPLPTAPVIATQSGHAYPGGVSSLTISQNTGNVILMTSGCLGGTITWQGGGSNTLAVSTMNTGVQTFTATCTSNSTGCTSPIGTATVTVVPTTLSVLHRDGNGQLNTNTLAPYLELQNDGNTAIPYQEITVRYWLTVENYAPLLFSINYAQLGSDKVHLKYVPAATGNPTATGYIEFSFDASAGSLGAMSNSGPIQDLINKQDYSAFDQSNDYSYAAVGQFTPNNRITAYRNGVLFYGLEPGPVVPMQSVKAMLQNNTGADANSIEAVLSVTNDGNVPINYGDLKVRYYFTADNNQPLVLSQAGYTALGSGNVSAQIVTINPALAGADRYLELSFSPSLGQLSPGASTGGVTYQIRHADYSGFNQNNDYSYQGTGGTMVNPHVVVFVAGQRAYGTEPGTGARLSAESVETPLRVQVLGNPVTGSSISVSVRGAEGQALRYELTDVSGHVVGERQVESAGAIDQQSLTISHQPTGLLLLRVSTLTQSQTVKVLRQ